MTQTAASGYEGAEARPRLGELLVAKGVLTDDQLREALVAHRDSDVPLGRFLVESGYASAPAVAMALADQHGGLVNTEYGFATGHGTLPPVRRIDIDEAPAPAVELPPLVQPDEPPTLRLAAPAPPAPPAERNDAAEALRARIEQLTGELAAANAARAAAEQSAASTAQLSADLAAANGALVAAEQSAAELRTLAEAARTYSAEVATLRDQLAEEQASSTRLRVELEEAAERAASELAGAREQLSIERADRLALEAAAPEARVYAPGAHALFFRVGDRYRFEEREGAAPEAGSTVEVVDRAYEVLRVGPAPVPGYVGACAFLEPR